MLWVWKCLHIIIATMRTFYCNFNIKVIIELVPVDCCFSYTWLWFPSPQYVKYFFFFFFLIRPVPMAHGDSQAGGWNGTTSHWPMPQPQQHQIWAVSVTYTTAQGNARSLIHWARARIEPETHGYKSDSFLLSHGRNSNVNYFWGVFLFVFVCLFVCFVFLPFLGQLPWHMEVPRLGV